MYSFELPEIFKEHHENKDLKKALALVNELFDMFPREEDSITRIILEGLVESAEDEKEKLFYKYLLKHLEILYLNFCLVQA
jgi:hypothetical protein